MFYYKPLSYLFQRGKQDVTIFQTCLSHFSDVLMDLYVLLGNIYTVSHKSVLIRFIREKR